MSLSSTVGEFAKKRKYSDKAFLEIGSFAAVSGANAVTFAEPWNVAPTVYIASAAGGSGSANNVTTTGFNIQSSGTFTFKWAAIRFTDRTT